MIREPAVAGQFYPGWPDELREMVRYLIGDAVEKVEAIGAVCPHAGYMYSGSVAGAVFARLKLPDTVVLIGPNHRGVGKPFSIMLNGVWRTPLGETSINADLANAISDASRYLESDTLAHRYEHSLEVQVPFLQYLKPGITIVPIVLSHAGIEVYREIGSAIVKACDKSGIDALIVASSDMTHYEPHEKAKSKDKLAIDAILELDADVMVNRLEKYDITMCGYAPVICLITAAREMGARVAELVKYQTSGDTSGDYSSVVGYAGIIIRK
jgi:AmmeMemoRadiSam system protein B